jgi:sRNA-binding carbon storage regulator CsrA
MALKITRRIGQGFWVGDAHVRLVKVKGEHDIGVEIHAPRSIKVLRAELDDRPEPEDYGRHPNAYHGGRDHAKR